MMDAATLDGRTAALAAALAERGVAPGDRVLWCARATLPPSRRWWPWCAAAPCWCRSARRRPAPSSTTSSPTPVRPWRSSTGRGPMPRHRAGPLRRAGRRPLPCRPHRTPGPSTLPARKPADDALIVYTSGTTGKPKGAVHTHGSLLAGVTALLTAWAWEPEDRLVLCLPLFHVHGLCAGLFGTLAAGASAAVFARFDEAADPAGGARGLTVLRCPDHVPPTGGDG